jgi:hypothetical protein
MAHPDLALVFACLRDDCDHTEGVVKSRASKAIALFAGVHLLGGHWLALQMVAWMGMFAANSQQGDLAGALEKTFDGKHPCPLCAAVEVGQQKEKEQQQKQLVDTVNKVNAVPMVAFVLPQPTETVFFYFETAGSCDFVSIRPPSPPPWLA